MNKFQERQILIALLPKRFQFHSNDPILRKHPHLSGQNNVDEQQESFPEQIKKQQELKLKQLIMSKKQNKSKQNMLKQLENEDSLLHKNISISKRNKKEDFRMINLNQLDKHYRVRGNKIEQKDKIGQNSFNLEQIQYETLGEEDEKIQKSSKIVCQKKIDSSNFQYKLSQQQTQDQSFKEGDDITVQYQVNNNKNQIQNLNDIRQRRNLMRLELNDKQSFELKQNISKSSAKSADYYQQIDLRFNNNSLNSSQLSPKIKKKLRGTKLQQENQCQNNQLDSLNHSQIQGMSSIFLENEKQQYSNTNRDQKNYAKFLNFNIQRKAQLSTPSSSTNQNSHRNSKEMINDLLNISSIYNQPQENKFANSITPKSFYGFPVTFTPMGESAIDHNNIKELDFSKSNKIDKSNTNASCCATPCQEIGSPQLIFRKKKETMNKILGFLSKDKQPNIYEKMILKNKQIHLTGHHIESFSSAYKSHLGIPTNPQQSSQQNYLDLHQQNKIETQKTERIETEREGQEFSNIKLKQWINQGQNTKDTAQFGKSEDVINYKQKTNENFQESQICAFYPYNQIEQNKFKKEELISVNKILIQPRVNLRNAMIQRPLSTQTTFQPNCQSYLMNSSNPTSPSRYATPKDIQRKNIQTPQSQIGQQDNQRSKSNIYQASRKSSINQNNSLNLYNKSSSFKQNEQLKQEKKQAQNSLIDNDKIERWIVNDIDIEESMSPLADKTNSFF
ncbi:hypothetical protein ABPG74_012673 [Tetrahymena malaccensis]